MIVLHHLAAPVGMPVALAPIADETHLATAVPAVNEQHVGVGGRRQFEGHHRCRIDTVCKQSGHQRGLKQNCPRLEITHQHLLWLRTFPRHNSTSDFPRLKIQILEVFISNDFIITGFLL